MLIPLFGVTFGGAVLLASVVVAKFGSNEPRYHADGYRMIRHTRRRTVISSNALVVGIAGGITAAMFAMIMFG